MALRDASDKNPFPTYVGVIPYPRAKWLLPFSFPHLCGGDSNIHSWDFELKGLSPPMWG